MNGALEQRTAEDITEIGELRDQPIASADGLFTRHLY